MSSQQRRFTRVPRAIGLMQLQRNSRICSRPAAPPEAVGNGTNRHTDSPLPSRIKEAPSPSWWTLTARPSPRHSRQDHPEYKVNIQTYDGNSGGTNSFQTKISLADKAGSGWPDVVWSGQVNDASWAAVVEERRSGFRRAARRGRHLQEVARRLHEGRRRPGDGQRPHLRCPRQPGAGGVLVQQDPVRPVRVQASRETWEDYQALGDKLAAEHPGYTLGSIGDSFTADADRHVGRSGADLHGQGQHVHGQLRGRSLQEDDRPPGPHGRQQEPVAVRSLHA